MGASGDGIDIGIGVHADAGAQQIIDALVAKFAALRANLNDTSKSAAQFTLTTAEQKVLLASVGGDFERYRAALGSLKASYDAINAGAAMTAAIQRQAGQAAQDATGKIRLFGSAADAEFQRIPRGARTAATAFQTLALSVETGAGSMRTAVSAAGSLAFGVAQLSSSANVVAGAAGIGAAVTVLGVFIELLRQGTAETKHQDAALKAFGETNESFAARAKAVGDVVSFLSKIPGNNAIEVQLVGVTKQVDDARAALVKLKSETKDAFQGPGFVDNLAASEAPELALRAGNLIDVAGKLQTLRKSFADNTITIDEFNRQLKEIGRNRPEFSKEIAQSAELAANYSAGAEALRKLTAAALQARAETKGHLETFGFTPDLAKELDTINQRFAQLSKGALAVRAVEDEQKAVEKATAAWKQFVTTKAGDAFADITFAQAREQKNARALSQLETARRIVATERTVEGGTQLADAAQRETEKAGQLVLQRTQGQAAAQRRAADDEFAEGKKQLARMSGLDADRTSFAIALAKQHTEAILRINKDEADKITALLSQLSDQRIQAEAKLSDDEFGKRRADAQRQFDADTKRITDAKLNANQESRARSEAARALTANLASIEKDRTDRLTEIDTQAREKIDELTGRTGDVDAAKIREGFKKQLDVLAATIASTSTTPVEKALARQGQKDIEALIPLEVAKARMAEVEKVITAAATSADSAIATANALLNAHAISQTEARQAILTALVRERDAVAASLPLLKTQADNLPGNADAQAKLDQYRVKLLDLNLAIAQTSDEFFKLKENARESATSAISTLIQNAATVGTGATSEIRGLTTQLRGAQDELNAFLKIPAAERTGAQDQRITDLRNEIERTSVSLDNAKKSIITWRDLFADALKTVADQVGKVASDSLAKLTVDAVTGLFRDKSPSAASLATGAASVAAASTATAAAATALSGAGASVSFGGRAVSLSSVSLSESGGVLIAAARALEGAAAAIAAAGLTVGSSSAVDSILSRGIPGVEAIGFSGGGQFRGRPGRDTNLAWLTDEEYIISAPRVRQIGVAALDQINFGGQWPIVTRADMLRGYAEGGLVTAAPVAGGGTWKGESVVRIQASRDVIMEVMRSDAGQKIQLENLQRNGHHVRALFGGRP